jgi:hypothetical protein
VFEDSSFEKCVRPATAPPEIAPARITAFVTGEIGRGDRGVFCFGFFGGDGFGSEGMKERSDIGLFGATNT